jgi:hypothetical protein
MNKNRTFKKFSALVLMLALLFGVAGAAETTVFINEIHYDNAGGDTGEAIEIAGPAGTDLNSWSLVLYNGNGGAPYGTISLTGVIPDQDGGFGTLSFPKVGIQNDLDGIALVVEGDPNIVIQFLSYEGTFTATDGPAKGMISIDIGVEESSSTQAGFSLQLSGTGSTYEDFTWSGPATSTFGAVNTGQTFVASESIPEFPTLALPLITVIVLMFLFWRKRGK